jgi:hypothetical protein
MNKILSFLLLMLGSMNVAAADTKPVDLTEFFSGIGEFHQASLLELLIQTTMISQAMEKALIKKISANLTETEKSDDAKLIKNWIDKKEIGLITSFYESLYKNLTKDPDKNVTEKTIYEDLIKDIFKEVPTYLKTAIKILYDSIDPKNEEILQKEFTLNSNILLDKLITNTVAERMKSAKMFAGYINDLIKTKREELTDRRLIAMYGEHSGMIAKLAFNDWVDAQLKTRTPEAKDDLPYRKISTRTLIAFFATARAHCLANADGDRFSSDISHCKHIIERTNIIKDSMVPFNNLAIIISDKARAMNDPNSKGNISLARYTYIVSKPLVGEKKKIKFIDNDTEDAFLDRDTTTLLEKWLRKLWAEDTEEVSIENLGTLTNVKLKKESSTFDAVQDGQAVKIERHLLIFDNIIKPPAHWTFKQTNVFLSFFILSDTKDINPSPREDFNLAPGQYCYRKTLQHCLNLFKYQSLNAEFSKKAYLGTDKNVPRTLILGDYNDISDLQTTAGCVVLSDNLFNDDVKPYKCKQSKNEQILICSIAYDAERLVPEKDLNYEYLKSKYLEFKKGPSSTYDTKLLEFEEDCVKSKCLELEKGRSSILFYTESKDGSRTNYVLDPRQIYIDHIIEYEGQHRPPLTNQTPTPN